MEMNYYTKMKKGEIDMTTIEVFKKMIKERTWKKIDEEEIALRSAIELIEENEKMKQEIKNLKKALMQCSPLKKTHTRWIECDFCGMNEHTDDCEYVKLCGSDINVTTKDGGA